MCAHETAEENLRFAKTVEPEKIEHQNKCDSKLAQVRELREMGEFTVGSTLLEEVLYNPYLRCCDRHSYYRMITYQPNDNPIMYYAKIRKWRDSWNPDINVFAPNASEEV